jgi:hypothetical protein
MNNKKFKGKIIIVLIMLMGLGSCNYKRGYLFEVYQNGIKIDEVCLREYESLVYYSAYYKKTYRKCGYDYKR